MKRHFLLSLFVLATFLSASCGARAAPEALYMEAPAHIAIEAEDSMLMAGAPQMDAGVEFNAGEPPTSRLVVRNADLVLVVSDPAKSVDEIGRMAEQMGGFIVSSSVYQTTFEDGVQADQASIMIRVPSEQMEDALKQIKEGATEVRSENTSGQDVTQEYTDLNSRLRNLEATEVELLEIMGSAKDADDVLRVYERLQQVREQIEITTGRIQYYEESARLSAIRVELLPDEAARPLQIGRWQPEGTAKAAVQALISALKFLGNTAIWTLICIAPIALILGVPGYFALRAILRYRKKKVEKPETE
jgi:hypothetical protein